MLILGFGYTAEALSAHLLRGGWRVIGVSRDVDKAVRMRRSGVEPVFWDEAAPLSDSLAAAFAQTTHLLASAAPDAQGDPFLRLCGGALASLQLRWAGYLSTIGVYGDAQGAWVDESAPLRPSTPRGKRRVVAEQAWQRACPVPAHIFRLAGIYGPGRGPLIKVQNGTARRIIKPGQFFSRIHVEDIAHTILASLQRPNAGAAYNLCDDDPAPPQDVIAYAAALLGLPAPPEEPFETAQLSPMARSFYAESKRVRNERIKRELGVSLLYPSYREGLGALLRAE